MGDESSSTVLVAAAANLCLAAAKLVAGLASGSGAMLSEAAHSVGDTVNEAFLLVAIRRGSRPADRLHPFGYGMEQYFWSLLAAVGVFVLGAGFATYQGISTLLRDSTSGPAFWAFVVLGLAFALEGTSLAGPSGSCGARRATPGSACGPISRATLTLRCVRWCWRTPLRYWGCSWPRPA